MARSMFKKLYTGTAMDFAVLDTQIEFDLDAEQRKIRYSNVSSAYLDRFIASLGVYGKHFYTSYVDIEADVPPHTDIVDSVSLNFYIETGGYRTVFYESNDSCEKSVYADHGDGHVYKVEDLTELGSFIAEPGDVYLLNGKVIHGVSSLSAVKHPRKFLQLSTNDLSYDQVSDILRTVC
jgi:hypothetical protein